MPHPRDQLIPVAPVSPVAPRGPKVRRSLRSGRIKHYFQLRFMARLARFFAIEIDVKAATNRAGLNLKSLVREERH